MQFLLREDGKQELAGVDWIFNAWGGKNGGLYKSWDKDQKVGEATPSHTHSLHQSCAGKL